MSRDDLCDYCRKTTVPNHAADPFCSDECREQYAEAVRVQEEEDRQRGVMTP